eukprot:2952639-Lingulodinium_polyedra.AAC.1
MGGHGHGRPPEAEACSAVASAARLPARCGCRRHGRPARPAAAPAQLIAQLHQADVRAPARTSA